MVVIDAGAPVALPWLDQVASVVDAWDPGQESGSSLVDILFGKVDSSGHLPVTFPTSLADIPTSTAARFPRVNGQVLYSEGLDVGYRWSDANKVTPLFPFGYGLPYTSFAFSRLSVVPGLGAGPVTSTSRPRSPTQDRPPARMSFRPIWAIPRPRASRHASSSPSRRCPSPRAAPRGHASRSPAGDLVVGSGGEWMDAESGDRATTRWSSSRGRAWPAISAGPHCRPDARRSWWKRWGERSTRPTSRHHPSRSQAGQRAPDQLGYAKITDFGLAKRLDGEAAFPTLTEQFLGTPSYMAPEQAVRAAPPREDPRRGRDGRGRGHLQPGCDPLELLTGRPPFRPRRPWRRSSRYSMRSRCVRRASARRSREIWRPFA